RVLTSKVTDRNLSRSDGAGPTPARRDTASSQKKESKGEKSTSPAGERTSRASLDFPGQLFSHPFITIPNAARFLEPTDPATQNDVEKLVGGGIVQQRSGALLRKAFVDDEILRRRGEPLTDMADDGLTVP